MQNNEQKQNQNVPNNPPRTEAPKADSTPVAQPLPPQKTYQTGKKIFLGFILSIIGLFAVFYGLLLIALLNGDLSNPLFESIGFNPAELKSSLLLITNSIFGFISLIFLIASLVKFFQWIIAPRGNFDRKQKIKTAGVYFTVLILTIGIWIMLFWVISKTSTKQTDNQNTLIISEPENTIGLTSPMTIKFDIGENIFKQIPPELIRQINWDFNGDGLPDASGPSVTYEFLDKGENNGRYEALVEVIYFSPETKQEKKYTDGKEVIISNEAIVADLIANPLVGQAPLEVTLSAGNSKDPDGSVVLYEWDLDGDEDYEIRGKEKVKLDTVFSTIGEHIVRLRVNGQNNDFAVAEKTIIVEAPDEKIRAEISSQNSDFSGLVPLEITLDGSQSFTKKGRIVQYEWNIEGEDRSILSRKVQRKFSIPGEYTVTLTIENEDGDRDQVTQVINVFEKSEIKLKTNPAPEEDSKMVIGTAPFDVVFDSSESEIPRAIEWQWDFDGDGIVDNFGKKTKHLFKVPGMYEVKLSIIDSDNRTFTTTQKIKVVPPALMADIQASPISGESPVVIHFDGSGSSVSDGEIIDYVWEFPGIPPVHSSAKISREFREVGTFTVRLTVVTDKGETDTAERLISVRAQTPQAEIDFTPQSGEAPIEIAFSSESSRGNIVEYFWDFGDNKTSTSINPKHTYSAPGTYTVKLKITDNNGIVSQTEETITLE